MRHLRDWQCSYNIEQHNNYHIEMVLILSVFYTFYSSTQGLTYIALTFDLNIIRLPIVVRFESNYLCSICLWVYSENFSNTCCSSPLVYSTKLLYDPSWEYFSYLHCRHLSYIRMHNSVNVLLFCNINDANWPSYAFPKYPFVHYIS